MIALEAVGGWGLVAEFADMFMNDDGESWDGQDHRATALLLMSEIVNEDE